ncbi:hypothetical protein HID58_057916 [Brassica napus]|uniref:Tetratricopeptide repeat protein n=1 Tax=Brassica napus TaxID=3708 RepID=A0ABQ7ZNI5_BRANA|nr:hypothetical protein HID58_057916 [Brassica napus]
MNKKRGRRQGSKKQISPEIQKRMTEAIFLHADNKDSEAFPILFDIINEAPAFGQAYYYLALVPDNLGKTEALEQGNMVLASDYVSKAVQADPEDIDLKYEYADLCLSAGKYKEAAETYEKIFRRHPDIIEPLKRGTEYFLKSGKGERAANMLEDHIKSHPSEVGPDILDLLADVLMQINAYDRALKYIHDVRQIYNLGKELPSSLKIRQAICHVRLEEMEQAEIVLNILPREAVSEHPKLIIDLADELTNIENFHSALKYYLLAINDTLNNGYLLVKAARCYMSLEKREQAIVFYYRALNELSDPIDARITLASLLLEDGKRDEAISVRFLLRKIQILTRLNRRHGGRKERSGCIFVRSIIRKGCLRNLPIQHCSWFLSGFCGERSREKENDRSFKEIVLEILMLPKNGLLLKLIAKICVVNLSYLKGFAFLYNNIRICSNSQEALYNVARAYHHVGLVTHAASYYDKVLAIYEKEYPMPKLPNVAEERKPVSCDLRKEAAHNLHLIYKHSGAFDLARQVLKDHCTF